MAAKKIGTKTARKQLSSAVRARNKAQTRVKRARKQLSVANRRKRTTKRRNGR